MRPSTVTILGRDDERVALARFLDVVPHRPSSLVLSGAAGIGKTTLWDATVADAQRRGFRVLTARPAESERHLAFTALADLLGGAWEPVAAALPAPQRRAVRAALLLEDGPGAAPDERAVGAGLLSVLGALARSDPVLVAVDDVQWLDTGSARALSFALRRLAAVPVGVLLARRAGESPAAPLEAELELDLGPLSAPALARVLAGHLGPGLAAHAVQRLSDVSGGNPFFALELARAAGGSLADPTQPLPVPSTLHELVRDRLATLPSPARDLLPVVAALPQATVGRLEAALGEDAGPAIEQAIDAGLLHLDGDRLRFSHPLLASAAYDELAGPDRRALHRRLASAAADVVERGHHVALATTAPDPGAAAQLDAAAAGALHRGAVHASAELHAHARRLTPTADVAASRRRAAAEAHLRALVGEQARAQALLEAVLADCEAGPARAPLLLSLARVESWGRDWRDAIELLRRALDEMDPGDADLRAGTELHLALTLDLVGDDPRRVIVHARRAAALAEDRGDAATLAEALAIEARTAMLLGEDATEVAARAVALAAATVDLSPIRRPADYLVATIVWRDELADGLRELRQIAVHVGERGEETALGWTLGRIALVLCDMGEAEQALAEAERGLAIAAHAGLPANEAVLLAVIARVAAQLGDEARARQAAERACALAGQWGAAVAARLAHAALGSLELSRGDARAAHAQLDPLVTWARAADIREPGAMRFVADDVEALVGLRELDAATELLDWYEHCARERRRASALCAAARCRGLLAAAEGDSATAVELLAGAAAQGAALPLPLERARTLLLLGVVQRRARQKRPARESLQHALAELERVGAALWAARARQELGRIGGRRTSGDVLTPTERRVADLVAAGHTNQQAAAELFVSVRSVEANLTRVYAKLGVSSRTELAARREQLGL